MQRNDRKRTIRAAASAAALLMSACLSPGAQSQTPEIAVPVPDDSWFVERIGPGEEPAAAIADDTGLTALAVAIPQGFADPQADRFLSFVLTWKLSPGARITPAELPGLLDRYYLALLGEGESVFAPELQERLRNSPSATWDFRPRVLTCTDGGLAYSFAASGAPDAARAPWDDLITIRDAVAC